MIAEQPLAGVLQGALLRPDRPSGLGVIVLTGASGRVDVDRARLFAERGAVALAQRWWGGPGQAQGVNEIPLEVVGLAVDRLRREGCARIMLLGTSMGAEAALSLAARDSRIDLVAAVSPTQVVWQNFGPGLDGLAWPPRSSFTWGGDPLPFMVHDPRAYPLPTPGGPRPSYRPMFERSLVTFAEDVAAATIPIERARADVILVAGGGDLLWPSDSAAREIAARLKAAGRRFRLVEHPTAGHSPVLPGESAQPEPPDRAWGGDPAADAALGAAAWAAISDWFSP